MTMVGQILAALEENGLLDNTLIVYTSDHGDMLGEHGLWWKHVFYEESVKVPLILSWPGVIAAGQRSDTGGQRPGCHRHDSGCTGRAGAAQFAGSQPARADRRRDAGERSGRTSPSRNIAPTSSVPTAAATSA